MASQALKPTNACELEQKLESFHTSSFGWALACCGWNREDAEEVLQASYLKAMEGRARFNGHSSTRTWFFGVVKNTAAETRRYRAVRGLALRRWFLQRPETEPVLTPETISWRVERHQALRRLLARLSPRQRDLLHLVFYQELTIEEAAGVLHVSLGTARTHYERGKARLRELLSKAGDDR
jgi:RNA polymerase sigma-70 factor (ECF subfamily)